MLLSRSGASCATTAAIVALCSLLVYHVLGAAVSYGPYSKEYYDRAKFLSNPENHEYAFLAGVVAESRRFLARGLFAPWILEYVNSLTAVRFFSESGYALGLAVLLLAIVGMVLLKCLLSERYAVDSMVAPMLEQNRMARRLAKQQARTEEEEVFFEAAEIRREPRERLSVARIQEIGKGE